VRRFKRPFIHRAEREKKKERERERERENGRKRKKREHSWNEAQPRNGSNDASIRGYGATRKPRKHRRRDRDFRVTGDDLSPGARSVLTAGSSALDVSRQKKICEIERDSPVNDEVRLVLQWNRRTKECQTGPRKLALSAHVSNRAPSRKLFRPNACVIHNISRLKDTLPPVSTPARVPSSSARRAYRCNPFRAGTSPYPPSSTYLHTYQCKTGTCRR